MKICIDVSINNSEELFYIFILCNYFTLNLKGKIF